MKKLILVVFTFIVMSSFQVVEKYSNASWYGEGSHTANGERYNKYGLTAAHKTLKFGTKLLVTNVKNGKSVVVRINDRGPFVSGRDIDLSQGAFSKIATLSTGVIKVKYEIIQ